MYVYTHVGMHACVPTCPSHTPRIWHTCACACVCVRNLAPLLHVVDAPLGLRGAHRPRPISCILLMAVPRVKASLQVMAAMTFQPVPAQRGGGSVGGWHRLLHAGSWEVAARTHVVAHKSQEELDVFLATLRLIALHDDLCPRGRHSARDCDRRSRRRANRSDGGLVPTNEPTDEVRWNVDGAAGGRGQRRRGPH